VPQGAGFGEDRRDGRVVGVRRSGSAGWGGPWAVQAGVASGLGPFQFWDGPALLRVGRAQQAFSLILKFQKILNDQFQKYQIVPS
jgi:hypothetical protein